MTDPPQTQDWKAFHTTETHRKDWAAGYERPVALERKPLLDKPSEPHPILSHLMDEALLSIMLVSDGGIARFTFATARSAEGDQTPTSDLAVHLDELGTRFAECRTHRRRLEVIKEAQDAAVRLRYSPESTVHGTIEWRRKVANDERSTGVVAIHFKITARTVSRYRKEFGTNRSVGRPRSNRTGLAQNAKRT